MVTDVFYCASNFVKYMIEDIVLLKKAHIKWTQNIRKRFTP